MIAVFIGLVGSLAKGSGHGKGGVMSHTQQLLERAVGDGTVVRAWRVVPLPSGVELFTLTRKPSADGPPRDDTACQGIAVVDGKLPWLQREQAMNAVVAAGVRDTSRLARIAFLLLFDDAGRFIARPDDSPSRPPEPEIAGPVKAGIRLTFWFFAGRPGLQRVHLDMSTWKWSEMPLSAVREEQADPIELAKEWLADSGEAANGWGIDKLVAACSDPRAGQMLVDTLRTHAKGATRALAATALATCRHSQGVDALIEAMAKDSDPHVRSSAADALRTLKDPAARSGLAKIASVHPDAYVRHLAKTLLDELPAR